MKRWYTIVFALVVIAIGWFAASWIMNQNHAPATPESPLASVSLASYTNAKGQTWKIPTGDYNFTVTSAEQYPKFVLGNINPVKISLGQTQHMSVVVRDNAPLVKVWAEIENDKSTDTVPLVMGASSTVSYTEIQNQKYLVNSANQLVLNDRKNNTSDIAALIQSLVQKAQAEQAVDYSYEGSWVAHDTRTVTYHTTFYAKDSLGRTASLVLAWSDPCSMSNNSLTGNCNLASTWGNDNASLSLNGHNVAMQSGGTLVFNPGQSITFPSGSSITQITGSTPIKKDYLYYADYDGDGYIPNTTEYAESASSLSHYRRVYLGSLGTDCDDFNANVHPGQTGYFSTAISDSGGSSSKNGTFDYNCDGVTSINPNQVNDAMQCIQGQDPSYTLGPGSAYYPFQGLCQTNVTIQACSNATPVSSSNCGTSALRSLQFYSSTSSCSGSAYGGYVSKSGAETITCH